MSKDNSNCWIFVLKFIDLLFLLILYSSRIALINLKLYQTLIKNRLLRKYNLYLFTKDLSFFIYIKRAQRSFFLWSDKNLEMLGAVTADEIFPMQLWLTIQISTIRKLELFISITNYRTHQPLYTGYNRLVYTHPGPKNQNFKKWKTTPQGIHPRDNCAKFQQNLTIFEVSSCPKV